jgi:hypothetical protein
MVFGKRECRQKSAQLESDPAHCCPRAATGHADALPSSVIMARILNGT